MVIPPSGGHNGSGGNVGDGYLRLLKPEHGRRFYCEQEHHLPVSGGGEKTASTGVQTLVGTGWGGCDGYADGGSVVGTDGGGGEEIQDRDGDRLSQCEDNFANVTLGTKLNAPLAYDQVL